MNKQKHNIIQSTKVSPWLVGVAAGLYPVLFYYTNNYSLIDSWSHLLYFATVFLLTPALLFIVIAYVIKNSFFSSVQKYILPFFNLLFFFFFIKLALFAGIKWSFVFLILILAALGAFFLSNHFKKIVQMQLILALIGFFYLVPTVYKQVNYSKEWMIQPDAIEEAIFTTTPNIYLIQPDGYVNFNMLKNELYAFDNSLFETYLDTIGFTLYPYFRNNYAATLPSNSSLFAMKHHYYNKGSNFSEIINARNVIMGNNSVLKILKQNGYTTSFIAQKPYFLVNKPNIAYDFVNFSESEISFITSGLEVEKDVAQALQSQFNDTITSPIFTFIQLLLPGHITSKSIDSKGKEGERQRYLEQLEKSNIKLTQLLNLITTNDPKAMIIIMADHGGYVGLEYTEQSYLKIENVALQKSIFGSALAIKWPKNEPPLYDTKIKTSVNLFRIITAYLSENKAYLAHLENDGSYVVIREGAPKGIYNYFNDSGEPIFKRYTLD